MTIKALTLFPEIFDALGHSITGRAMQSGILKVECLNIRDFSSDKHKRCDDAPFGGGAGMVMTAQPIADAMREASRAFPARRVCLSPRGEPFTQKKAAELSREPGLILLCGRYEGIDQRALDMFIDEEISIGDYVLTGGELAAMVVIDALSRLIPGVLGKDESAYDESFSDALLEYPQYTRPAVFEGVSVPDVLLSGHAANIKKWREAQALELTKKRRPDLYALYRSKAAEIKQD